MLSFYETIISLNSSWNLRLLPWLKFKWRIIVSGIIFLLVLRSTFFFHILFLACLSIEYCCLVSYNYSTSFIIKAVIIFFICYFFLYSEKFQDDKSKELTRAYPDEVPVEKKNVYSKKVKGWKVLYVRW